MSRAKQTGFLATIAPGLLIAATGVGAGDLAGASLAGSILGIAVLWVVVLGAFFKFVLNEGLTRWQLATGQTLLEGAIRRIGKPVAVIFLVYLVIWSVFVSSALSGAAGVVTHAMIPYFDDSTHGKIAFGIANALLGLALAWFGGFKIFERAMELFMIVMFITVVSTAVLLKPDWLAVLKGMTIPTIPKFREGGLAWSAALMGGVGGTVTVLCYGYWIREAGRHGAEDLRTCRIDLGVGYIATAIFGVSMVIIGSGVNLKDKPSASLCVELADILKGPLGSVGRWSFLLGAWAAIFTSILGVWQAVPYLFADAWRLLREKPADASAATPGSVDKRSLPYRGYMLALVIVPLLGLFLDFKKVQWLYSTLGATFMPLMALTLLVLNGRAKWVGRAFTNKPATVAVLLIILVIFAAMGIFGITDR